MKKVMGSPAFGLLNLLAVWSDRPDPEYVRSYHIDKNPTDTQ